MSLTRRWSSVMMDPDLESFFTTHFTSLPGVVDWGDEVEEEEEELDGR